MDEKKDKSGVANPSDKNIAHHLRELFEDIDAIQNLRQSTANQQLILFYDRLLRSLQTELEAFALASAKD